MGIFTWKTPQRVTPREYNKKVKTSLASKGVSRRSIRHVSEVSDTALNAPGRARGITAGEKDQIVRTLRSPKSTHRMSEKTIDTVDRTLSKNL